MSSVPEQLQNYRAMKARQNAALLQRHPHAIQYKHPKTTDYFSALMQRWQSASQDGAMVPAQASE